jgi:hypothetical protein
VARRPRRGTLRGVTERPPPPEGSVLRLVLLATLVLLACTAPLSAAPAPEPPAPGAAILVRAEALAAQWGRCPTARPAHRVLDQARRTTAPVPRVRRARAALRSWTAVARECARPVAQPEVIVSG